MKLKTWADKTGVKYLTAYRWFKAGTLPVPAYQTSSGTIIVEDADETKEKLTEEQVKETMASFLKSTVEFSKSKASVEDFAAYVISNYNLQLNSSNINQLSQLNNIVETNYSLSNNTLSNTNDWNNVTTNNFYSSNNMGGATFSSSQVPSYFGNSGTNFGSGINPNSDDIEKAKEVLEKVAETLRSSLTPDKKKKSKGK